MTHRIAARSSMKRGRFRDHRLLDKSLAATFTIMRPHVEDREEEASTAKFPIQNAVPSRFPPVVTWALIAANCVALAADEIVMCQHSALGPIDPQLGQSPRADGRAGIVAPLCDSLRLPDGNQPGAATEYRQALADHLSVLVSDHRA